MKAAESKQDETILSVTYDVYYQKFEEEPKIEKDLMRLDIAILFFIYKFSFILY